MTETDLAYIAGIVDGEGFISVNTCYAKVSKQPRVCIEVGVQMTDVDAITFIQHLFGGRIRIQNDSTGKRKPLYRWKVSGYTAKPLLEAIKPFLIIKRSKAEIALRILSSHDRYQHYTPMERFLQEADALAIKALNK